jgi:hypothetical protein
LRKSTSESKTKKQSSKEDVMDYAMRKLDYQVKLRERARRSQMKHGRDEEGYEKGSRRGIKD